MSWGALLGLAAAAYALKALGPVLLGRRRLPADAVAVLEMMSIPLLGALVAVQTFGLGRSLVLDARAPALAVAAVLVWRRAPFLVVVVSAAATAALIRQL